MTMTPIFPSHSNKKEKGKKKKKKKRITALRTGHVHTLSGSSQQRLDLDNWLETITKKERERTQS